MEKALLSDEDRKRFAGQYVCVADFQSEIVVSSDKDPVVARRKAKEAGYGDPVLFYVPFPDDAWTFSALAVA